MLQNVLVLYFQDIRQMGKWESSQNHNQLSLKKPEWRELKNMILDYPKKIFLIFYTWVHTKCNSNGSAVIRPKRVGILFKSLLDKTLYWSLLSLSKTVFEYIEDSRNRESLTTKDSACSKIWFWKPRWPGSGQFARRDTLPRTVSRGVLATCHRPIFLSSPFRSRSRSCFRNLKNKDGGLSLKTSVCPSLASTDILALIFLFFISNKRFEERA